MEDPFELDQQSLEAKLKLLQGNFDRWRRIKSSVGDAMTSAEEMADAADEFHWLTNEIEKAAKSIGWDVDDLGETLKMMQEKNPNPAQQEARSQYIRNTRTLLEAIDSEVKAGKTRFVDAGVDSTDPIGQPGQPINGEMSTSTERLVQSLFQEDDELLIQDDARGRRTTFNVAVDSSESPLRRFWRRHKPALYFVSFVLLLLLIVLIISLATRSGSGFVSSPASTSTTPVAGGRAK